MATVSAPAPLKLGEGVGLLLPSVPITLSALPQWKPTSLEVCFWWTLECHGHCQLFPARGQPGLIAEEPA